MTDLFALGRKYDLHEIVADGVVHGVGIVLALIGVTALIFYATLWASFGQLAAAWIYGIGLVLCLSISSPIISGRIRAPNGSCAASNTRPSSF